MNEKRKRPKYPKEFRQDAIKLVTEQGHSCNEAGRRLGINLSNISRWVREYRQGQQDIAEGGVTRKELKAKTPKRYKVTTDSNHSFTVAPSLVNRQF